MINQLLSGRNIFILVIFLYGFLAMFASWKMNNSDESILAKSNIVTEGIITEFPVSGRTGSAGEYSFLVKDKKFIGSFQLDKFCKKPTYEEQLKLQKLKFPVAYNPHNPEINRIVLTEVDFYTYQLKRPEKLMEIFSKYFDCQ